MVVRKAGKKVGWKVSLVVVQLADQRVFWLVAVKVVWMVGLLAVQKVWKMVALMVVLWVETTGKSMDWSKVG